MIIRVEKEKYESTRMNTNTFFEHELPEITHALGSAAFTKRSD